MAGSANTYRFKPGAKVRAVEDLRGVPEGTRGKVAVANGITWHRYWVRFDNGMMLGFVDESQLVAAKRYETFKLEREQGARRAEEQAAEAAAAPSDVEETTPADDDSAKSTAIPSHLLDRSKSARERLHT